mgnify:CR=1 FL=1
MALGNLGKYSQLLQNMPNPNTGTHAGGLSHVLQQALLGYSAGQDQRAEEATQGRYEQMLRAMTGTPDTQGFAPDHTYNPPGAFGAGVGGPPPPPLDPDRAQVTIPGEAPDLMGAINIGAGDPALQELTFGLLNQRNQNIAAAEAAEAARADALFDTNAANEQAMAMAQFEVDNRVPPAPVQPRFAEAADGFLYWIDGPNAGQRVRPGIDADPSLSYEGSLEAQHLARLLVLGPDGGYVNADHTTQQYAVAFSALSEPKLRYDDLTGESTWHYPDMSRFLEPTFQFNQQGEVPDNAAPTAVLSQEALPGQPAYSVTEQTGAPRFTPQQAESAGFADRLYISSLIIEGQLESALSLSESMLSDVPMFGNYLIEDATQQLQQAQRDFVNAKLRKESGAAIAPSEFASAELQYFPLPGDGPDVIAQKKANRELVYNGLVRESGPAYVQLNSAPSAPEGIPENAQYQPSSGNWWWPVDPNNPDGEWEHN